MSFLLFSIITSTWPPNNPATCRPWIFRTDSPLMPALRILMPGWEVTCSKIPLTAYSSAFLFGWRQNMTPYPRTCRRMMAFFFLFFLFTVGEHHTQVYDLGWMLGSEDALGIRLFPPRCTVHFSISKSTVKMVFDVAKSFSAHLSRLLTFMDCVRKCLSVLAYHLTSTFLYTRGILEFGWGPLLDRQLLYT